MSSNDNIIQTVKNALKVPATAMALSVINNTRVNHPRLFNSALSQFNNEQRQAGRPISQQLPVELPVEHALQPAGSVRQTVNTQQDEELESLDEEEPEFESQEPAFDELEEEILSTAALPSDEDDESIDDEDEGDVPEEEDTADDFEDEDEELLNGTLGSESDPDFADFVQDESEPEQIPSIEFISFRHTLSVSLYLNDFEGEQYSIDGRFFTSKQPLRRGKGVEGDAAGSVRASLESFIESVRIEGEGLRMPMGVTDDVVDRYVSGLNSSIEQRLSESFNAESQAYVSVSATSEVSESPWGSDARVITRNIGLSFPIPAIVNAGRKQKDELKMLASNLKIVNNLVRQLKESANVESVQVNILIQDAVIGEMANVFSNLLSEGNAPVFERGYARFTVQTEDNLGGEVEG